MLYCTSYKKYIQKFKLFCNNLFFFIKMYVYTIEQGNNYIIINPVGEKA